MRVINFKSLTLTALLLSSTAGFSIGDLRTGHSLMSPALRILTGGQSGIVATRAHGIEILDLVTLKTRPWTITRDGLEPSKVVFNGNETLMAVAWVKRSQNTMIDTMVLETFNLRSLPPTSIATVTIPINQADFDANSSLNFISGSDELVLGTLDWGNYRWDGVTSANLKKGAWRQWAGGRSILVSPIPTSDVLRSTDYDFSKPGPEFIARTPDGLTLMYRFWESVGPEGGTSQSKLFAVDSDQHQKWEIPALYKPRIFSSTKDRFVLSSYSERRDDIFLNVHDTQTGAIIGRLAFQATIRDQTVAGLAFNSDGSHLYVHMNNGNLYDADLTRPSPFIVKLQFQAPPSFHEMQYLPGDRLLFRVDYSWAITTLVDQ